MSGNYYQGKSYKGLGVDISGDADIEEIQPVKGNEYTNKGGNLGLEVFASYHTMGYSLWKNLPLALITEMIQISRKPFHVSKNSVLQKKVQQMYPFALKRRSL